MHREMDTILNRKVKGEGAIYYNKILLKLAHNSKV
jgi:hypothetical protein